MLSYTFIILLVAAIVLIVTTVSSFVKRLSSIFNLKNKTPLRDFLVTLPVSIIAVISLVVAIPNYTPVVKMKNATGQSLVFIGMQHVGVPSYYDEVNSIIIDLRNKGYTILHEGVGMRGDVSITLKSCSRTNETPSPYGLISQPKCIGEYHQGDKYADIDYFEFIDLYTNQLQDKLGISKEEALKIATSKRVEINNEVEEIKNNFIDYFATKLMSMNTSFPYFFSSKWQNNDNEDPVIMGKRNEILVDYISSIEKPATAYGMAHISGVVNMLKEKDSTWEVIEVDQLRVL